MCFFWWSFFFKAHKLYFNFKLNFFLNLILNFHLKNYFKVELHVSSAMFWFFFLNFSTVNIFDCPVPRMLQEKVRISFPLLSVLYDFSYTAFPSKNHFPWKLYTKKKITALQTISSTSLDFMVKFAIEKQNNECVIVLFQSHDFRRMNVFSIE